MSLPTLPYPTAYELAWEVGPSRVEGEAGVLVAVTGIMLALCSIAIGLRVYVRAWVYRADKIWGWDDSLALLSFLTYIPSCAYTILAARYGLASPDATTSPSQRARAALYMGHWQIFYAVSVNLCKAGIAVALLRITQQRRYRYPLLAILAAAPALTAIVLAILIATCRPIGAQWALELGPCPTHDVMAQLSYLFTVMTVLQDWACAGIPYLLLKDLVMPRRTKLSLLVVLSIGSFASVAAIIRLPYLKYYQPGPDQLYHFHVILLWSTVENGVGIVAAALPPVRKLFSFFRETRAGSVPQSGPSARARARARALETVGGTPLDGPAPAASLRMTAPKPGRDPPLTAIDPDWDHRSSSQEHMV